MEIVPPAVFLTEKNIIFLWIFLSNKLAGGQSPNYLKKHFKKWPYLYKIKIVYIEINDNASQKNQN